MGCNKGVVGKNLTTSNVNIVDLGAIKLNPVSLGAQNKSTRQNCELKSNCNNQSNNIIMQSYGMQNGWLQEIVFDAMSPPTWKLVSVYYHIHVR